jgi:diguanylate cyclase (GGDEF)-like protein/PAS domain S-box-containing protein
MALSASPDWSMKSGKRLWRVSGGDAGLDEGNVTGQGSEGAVALWSWLADNPAALVAAIGIDGRLVPVPESLQLEGHHLLGLRTGLDLVIPADQLLIVDGWARASQQPIVRLEVHLVPDPEQLATLHLFDVRPEHGVHVITVVASDPEHLLASAEASAALPGGVGHIRKDAVAVILEVDAATTGLLGWSAEELVGRRTVDLVHPDDVERAIEGWMDMRDGTGSGRVQLRHRHAAGHYVWLEVTNENRLDDPAFGCVISELVDISAQMAQFQALQERERLLDRLADALPIGICHLRLDGEVVYSNELLIALLGPVDSIDTLVRSVSGADRRAVGFALENALQGRAGDLEVGVMHGFEERRCELTFRTMTSEDGGVDGVIVCASDVTDRSRLRSELEHRASHDELSGCLNRAATVVALEQALRGSEEVAVVYLDLDHFKAVNDELGHAAGDELLRVAAARLRSAARANDRIGRIGGDEFVVICRRGDGPFETAALVDRFTQAVSGDVVFAKQRTALRASVGAAIAAPGEMDAEAVLSRADAAMYEAKRRSHEARPMNLRIVPASER